MRKIVLMIILLSSHLVFAKEYYVSTKGNDKNDGKSESRAWRTISHAAKKAKAGDTVWIKAGNYGNEKVVVKHSGKKNKPISFIGYKNRPGDISSMYYSYKKGKALDSKEMPLLYGKNRSENIGILLTGKEYISIKNIQIKNYQKGIFGSGSSFNVIENVLAHSFGSTENDGGRGIHYGGDYNKILNSTFINSTAVNVTVYGDNNLIEGVKSYCDESLEVGRMASTDYYLTIQGSKNIIRDCYVERVGDLKHNGHGIALKSKGVKTEENLVENCTIVNVKGAIEARHRMVKNNTFKNLLILGWDTPSQNGGIVIQDGASYNTFERIKISGTNEAFRWYETIEDEGVQENGHHNIFKNIIVENVPYLVVVGALNVTPKMTISNNLFVNCTFNNIGTVFLGYGIFDSTNSIENCIFNDVKNYNYKKWSELYNNYYEIGSSFPTDNNNISENPRFEDLSKGNYKLKSTSFLIDAGKHKGTVKKDFDGKDRPKGDSHDIGAYEYQNNSTSSVKANAGEDQVICLGEEVVLTASGGSTYRWSNGATTKSITVSPTTSQTYTATVSEGSSSDTDEVIVTVNEIKADAGADETINEGESITLNASGGDSYLWSNGETTEGITVSPSVATTYSVTVTKNGCEATDQVNVNVNTPSAPIVVTADAGEDQTVCLGEEIILTASGGSIYTWSNGATTKNITVNPTETTTYIATVSEGSSSDTDEVIVTVNEIKADAGADETINEGESITLNASGGDSYLWSNGETTEGITVSPSVATTYSVTVTKNDCEATDEVVVIVNQDEISNHDDFITSISMDIIIFPNPSNGQVHVKLNQTLDSNANLTVISINGGIMYNGILDKSQNSLETKIDLTGVDKGIYFVRLMTLDDSIIKKLIVI